jgi:hypothetical protein
VKREAIFALYSLQNAVNDSPKKFKNKKMAKIFLRRLRAEINKKLTSVTQANLGPQVVFLRFFLWTIKISERRFCRVVARCWQKNIQFRVSFLVFDVHIHRMAHRMDKRILLLSLFLVGEIDEVSAN